MGKPACSPPAPNSRPGSVSFRLGGGFCLAKVRSAATRAASVCFLFLNSFEGAPRSSTEACASGRTISKIFWVYFRASVSALPVWRIPELLSPWTPSKQE